MKRIDGRRAFLSSNDETFHFTFSERHYDAAPGLDRFIHTVNKSARQRQTHRYIDIHGKSELEPEELGPNLLHVFPYFAFLVGRTEQVRRMKCCNDPHAIHVVKLSPQLGNRRDRLKNGLRGKSSETTDDLRANGGELFFHERITRSDFI